MASESKNEKIRLMFHFTTHATEQDALDVGKTIAEFKPHVVCMEYAAASEQQANVVEQEFAKENPLFWQPDPYYEMLQREMKKNNARVFVPETFSEEEARQLQLRHRKVVALQAQALNQFVLGEPQKAVESFRQHLQLYAESNVSREKLLREVISNLHERVVKKFPELTTEPEVRVLFAYGVGHSPLYLHARKSGGFKTIERRTPALPHHFSQVQSHVRRVTFGKPRKYTDNEVARALLSTIVSIHVSRRGINTSDSHAYADFATRKISLADLQKISGDIAREIQSKNPRTREEAAPLLEKAFENSGMQIPNSGEEIRRQMRKAGIRLSE